MDREGASTASSNPEFIDHHEGTPTLRLSGDHHANSGHLRPPIERWILNGRIVPQSLIFAIFFSASPFIRWRATLQTGISSSPASIVHDAATILHRDASRTSPMITLFPETRNHCRRQCPRWLPGMHWSGCARRWSSTRSPLRPSGCRSPANESQARHLRGQGSGSHRT